MMYYFAKERLAKEQAARVVASPPSPHSSSPPEHPTRHGPFPTSMRNARRAKYQHLIDGSSPPRISYQHAMQTCDNDEEEARNSSSPDAALFYYVPHPESYPPPNKNQQQPSAKRPSPRAKSIPSSPHPPKTIGPAPPLFSGATFPAATSGTSNSPLPATSHKSDGLTSLDAKLLAAVAAHSTLLRATLAPRPQSSRPFSPQRSSHQLQPSSPSPRLTSAARLRVTFPSDGLPEIDVEPDDGGPVRLSSGDVTLDQGPLGGVICLCSSCGQRTGPQSPTAHGGQALPPSDASTPAAPHDSCRPCQLLAALLAHNAALKKKVASLSDAASRYRSLLSEARDEVATLKDAAAGETATARAFEELLSRARLEAEALEKRLADAEAREREEARGRARIKVVTEDGDEKQRVIDVLDTNKRLARENEQAQDDNEELKIKIANMRGRRKAHLEDEERERRLRHVVYANKSTDMEPFGVERGIEAETEISPEESAALKVASNATYTAEKETCTDPQTSCKACEGKEVGEKKKLTISVTAPAPAPKSKTPRTPKAPEARVILEAKVLNMMYDILEKKAILEASDESRGVTTKSSMSDFLVDYFKHKYGVAKLAAQQHANYVASLNVYADKNSRISHFLTMCGLRGTELWSSSQGLSDTYVAMLRAMYPQHEGISEKLDDGIGNVKLSVKQCRTALLGSDAKVADPKTWTSCDFLVKAAGPMAVKSLYEREVAAKAALNIKEKDPIDFDDFIGAVMALATDALDFQITTLKRMVAEYEADDDYLSLAEFKELLKVLKPATYSDEAAVTMFNTIDELEDATGVDLVKGELRSRNAVVAILFNSAIFAPPATSSPASERCSPITSPQVAAGVVVAAGRLLQSHHDFASIAERNEDGVTIVQSDDEGGRDSPLKIMEMMEA